MRLFDTHPRRNAGSGGLALLELPPDNAVFDLALQILGTGPDMTTEGLASPMEEPLRTFPGKAPADGLPHLHRGGWYETVGSLRYRTSHHDRNRTVVYFGPGGRSLRPASVGAGAVLPEPMPTGINASMAPSFSVIIKGYRRSQAFVAFRVGRFAVEVCGCFELRYGHKAEPIDGSLYPTALS